MIRVRDDLFVNYLVANLGAGTRHRNIRQFVKYLIGVQMKFGFMALLTILSLICVPATSAEETRPNILLIVADDLGFADLGVHGSRIQTPTIDSIAARGRVFSQFHTAPMCAPTRAMLLSGNNNHVAGVGNQLPSKLLDGTPGFEHHLSDRIVPFPKLLQLAGYNTYMAGKWHLGEEAEQSPIHAGFKRSWALGDGGANHFDSRGFTPNESRYFADGKEVAWPEGAYSTNFYTDKLISFLEADQHDDKPFFIYAAYTSPHWPLQVPDAELDRYSGAYDDGYEALRVENLANLKSSGLISSDHPLSQLHSSVQPWDSLTDHQKKRQARAMELYAAMVSNLDDNIARLLAALERLGELENTLVIFMGDNGAAPSDLYNRGPFTKSIRSKYDNSDLERYGTADTFVSLGYGWAEAAAPFKYVKGYPTEGGVRAPFIAAGPMVVDSSVSHDYFTVMDLAPTFLELAGADYPNTEGIAPLQGISLLKLLDGSSKSIHSADSATVIDHNNRALVRRGNWKLVSMDSFVEKFALYNVLDDPTEQHDIADQYPDIYNELLAVWHQKAREYGIVNIPDKRVMK